VGGKGAHHNICPRATLKPAGEGSRKNGSVPAAPPSADGGLRDAERGTSGLSYENRRKMTGMPRWKGGPKGRGVIRGGAIGVPDIPSTRKKEIRCQTRKKQRLTNPRDYPRHGGHKNALRREMHNPTFERNARRVIQRVYS